MGLDQNMLFAFSLAQGGEFAFVLFSFATQQGVVFHLLGALCEFGKLGDVCVADTIERARALYGETIAILDREADRG